jgi:hypothetical protein
MVQSKECAEMLLNVRSSQRDIVDIPEMLLREAHYASIALRTPHARNLLGDTVGGDDPLRQP